MSAPMGNRKVSGIYKITSPSGRVYVGQSVDINARFARCRGLHCRGQRRLYLSLKKYGHEAHEFSVIEELPDESGMVDRERFWQNAYDATGPSGLNCKVVSENCHAGRHSEETRALMSASAMGRKASDEAKIKMSQARLGRKMPEAQRLAMIGRKMPPHVIEKHRIRMMGNQYKLGITPKNAKKVICMDTGVVFNKVLDAAEHIGMKRSTLAAMLSGQNPNKTSMRYV